MKVLLTGCSGYVGGIVAPFLSDIVELYRTSSSRYKACDLRNIDDVQSLSEWVKPDVIVHAAGNKNIKFCEEHADLTHEINVTAVENLIKAFGDNVIYIYISSDYVFEGTHGNYSENDATAPFTVYGHQKLAAEDLFLKNASKSFIVRLSALFDRDGTFCKFLRSKFQANEAVECYEDVFYSPTYYRLFLKVLNTLIQSRDFTQRIFHCGGERVSRFEFAFMYAKHCGYSTDLVKRCRLFDTDNKSLPFLRQDISLNSEFSLKYLNVQPISLSAALKEL